MQQLTSPHRRRGEERLERKFRLIKRCEDNNDCSCSIASFMLANWQIDSICRCAFDSVALHCHIRCQTISAKRSNRISINSFANIGKAINFMGKINKTIIWTWSSYAEIHGGPFTIWMKNGRGIIKRDGLQFHTFDTFGCRRSKYMAMIVHIAVCIRKVI